MFFLFLDGAVAGTGQRVVRAIQLLGGSDEDVYRILKDAKQKHIQSEVGFTSARLSW